jgi:IclR family acetate operon transcriptional repressor
MAMATPRIQSVDRAFSLLTCLARNGDCESLPTMAAQCGLTVATAHRLLTTLEALGAVIHTAPGQYRIGMGLIALTRGASTDCLIAAAAAPCLRQITQTLCPTAHLGVLDSDYMVTYLAKKSLRSHQLPTRTGSKLEAYCSGLGKVLLAALPTLELDQYLAEGPFIRLTSRTMIETPALKSELAKVLCQGFAVDDRELFEDLRCVAVPVFDRSGSVVAALSASAPAKQMPKARILEVAGELTRHAARMGTKLFPVPGLNSATH